MTNQTTKTRDSFIFYRSFYQSIRKLPAKDKAEIFDAICAYALDGEEIELSIIPEALFTVIKPNLDANRRKWENGCKEKQKKSELEANNEQTISKSEANNKQTISKVEGNVNVDVDKDLNVDNNEKCLMKNVNKRFTPPTLQQVKDYCIEKGYLLDCQKFIDYYTASNWKDKEGKQVKNWKQKVITWYGRDKESLTLPSNVIEINKIAGDLVIKEIKEYPLEIDLVCVAGGAEKMRALAEDKRQAIKQKFSNKKINLV